MLDSRLRGNDIEKLCEDCLERFFGCDQNDGERKGNGEGEKCEGVKGVKGVKGAKGAKGVKGVKGVNRRVGGQKGILPTLRVTKRLWSGNRKISKPTIAIVGWLAGGI